MDEPVQEMYHNIDDIKDLLTSDSPWGKKVEMKEIKRIDALGPCWIVTSHKSRDGKGYQYFTRNGKNITGHRLVYKLFWGREIPDDLTISHLCELPYDRRSRVCLNPYHLVCETQSENLRRSKMVGRYDRSKMKHYRRAIALTCAYIN